MQSCARSGAAEATTIAAIAIVTIRALAAEISIVEKLLSKTNHPAVGVGHGNETSKATLPTTDRYNGQFQGYAVRFSNTAEGQIGSVDIKSLRIHANTSAVSSLDDSR